MKLKFQLVEGFWTTNWKEPIEVETDDYPELEGKTKEEAQKWIIENCCQMSADPKDQYADTIWGYAQGQDVEFSKEKNYDSELEIWDGED